MPFDIDGARKAGYSDAEIADFMAGQSKFDVNAARQSGYSDAEIIGHLSQQKAEKQEEPSTFSKAANLLGTAVKYGTPTGLAAQGMDVLNKALEKAAYEAGGYVTDKTGSPAAGGVTNLAINAIPAMIPVGEAAKLTSAPALEGMAKWLMTSALKPSSTPKNIARGKEAAETMLKEGADPTMGGVQKLKDTLSNLGGQAEEKLANSGATIRTKDVADYAPNALSRFENGPLARQSVEDIGKVQEGFITHPKVEGASEISVQQANQLKQGYQRAIGDKGYGELKNPTTEAEKQIARGLREKVAEVEPEVAALLAREQKILNALKFAERRAAVEANKNPLGLGILNPATLAPWLWDRSSLAKSLTARMLYSGQQNVPYGLGALLGATNSQGPALDPYSSGALYAPPVRGTPTGMSGGGSR